MLNFGRSKYNCTRGLGICRVCFFCERQEGEIEVPVLNDSDGEYIQIKLDKPLDYGINSDLHIDEDIYNEDDGKLIFKSGIHELDYNLGEYGGYEIRLENN